MVHIILYFPCLIIRDQRVIYLLSAQVLFTCTYLCAFLLLFIQIPCQQFGVSMRLQAEACLVSTDLKKRGMKQPWPVLM
jgi:hypothetical protein